jgi:dTDP-4-amino-4,6-dideoxyglucose formyltransferase
MYKDILVISDNGFMCGQFNGLMQELNIAGVNWRFATSPFSDPHLFAEQLQQPVMQLNLQSVTDVDEITRNYDLVFSMHCKQLFPAQLVNTVKCINVHPGYNPYNRGWYPQVFAIIHNLPTGATIHEMDEALDHGPIIDRALVEQTAYDDSLSLYNKILAMEISLLQKRLADIIYQRYETMAPGEEGQLFLKKDFNELLPFDLDSTMTGKMFINRLRALSHGDHKNAWFIDAATGKKIFIKLSLQPDE